MPSNIDLYCFVPVLKGLWKQHELWDGTYTLYDLLDIHEAIDIQQKNEKIVFEYQKQKAERKAELKRFNSKI